jgi:D-alanyl-D-alanine carboxypeptidase
MPKRSNFSDIVKQKWDKILLLFFLGLFFLFYPGQNIYTTNSEKSSFVNELPFAIPTPAPYPVNMSGIFPGPEVSAEGVVVQDVNSGVVLYKRNEQMLLSPASTTKILTALVALDIYDLDDVLTVKTHLTDGQMMGLLIGEKMTVENLLYGALIESGNDAAWTLADDYPGGVSAFVQAMNQKAKALHLEHSTFTNPVGYDDPNHKMTPMDLTRLASIALSNKTIVKMVAIPQITISDVTHTYYHPLKNVNELLGKIPGVAGIKTGWTEVAGENLVTFIDRDSHKIVVVVLHSKDRFGDTTKLIDWIFLNYTWKIYDPVGR